MQNHISRIRQLLQDAVPRRSETPGHSKHRTTTDAAGHSSVSRDCCIRRINDLRRLYRLGWLVTQETFNRTGLDDLNDAELLGLLQTMERARECIVEGIPLEDAGFMRSTTI